jgi:hypothetical protein
VYLKKDMGNFHVGSSFEDILAAEGILEQAMAVAEMRVIAWQLEQEMAAQRFTKSAMAKKVHPSRATLNRFLDATNTSLTPTTLSSAASTFETRVRFDLCAASSAVGAR